MLRQIAFSFPCALIDFRSSLSALAIGNEYQLDVPEPQLRPEAHNAETTLSGRPVTDPTQPPGMPLAFPGSSHSSVHRQLALDWEIDLQDL